jgi:HSP20 family protein
MTNLLPAGPSKSLILAAFDWHPRCRVLAPITSLAPTTLNQKEEGMASNGFTNGIAALDFALLNNRLSTLFADGGHETHAGGWAPAVNLQETAEGLIMTVEVPGMSREEIEVQMENEILIVCGDKRETASEEGRYHLRERAFGAFRRGFRMPRWVEGDRISAELANGVLTIRLPKAPTAQPRRVEIGAEQRIA